MSVERDCSIYKAQDNKFYLEIDESPARYGDDEDGDDDAPAEYETTGPFETEDAANDYLEANYSNPGSSWSDNSGKRPVPKSLTKRRGY